MRRCLPLLAAAAALMLAPASSAAVQPLTVIGFQEASDAPSLIGENAQSLSTVGVDGVNLTSSGAAVTRPEAAALVQLRRAHALGLQAVLLIGNWEQAIEDFSEPTAYALLSSGANIAAVAGQLSADVVRQGWDGISVDLESLAPRDRAGLVSFIGALRSDLPAQASVNVNITNYTSAAAYRANGYDLAALGQLADQVTLMAYDQHGPWDARPGPVGALSWVEHGLAVMLRSVPAAKLDLGVAGYGYAWGPGGDFQVSDAQARSLVAAHHARARYEPRLGEWTADLPDGTTLWWSDGRTFLQRASLALADHLHGLAVWSLALSDPLPLIPGQAAG